LDETDDCSGVAQGRVEVSIDGGNWTYHPVNIFDFYFIGSYGHSYQFRYRAQDNAGNWSNWTVGPIINVLALPTGTPTEVSWSFCPVLGLELSWNYSETSNLPQISFHIQIDDDQNFSSPEIDTGEISQSNNQYIFPSNIITPLANGVEYYWQLRVRSSAQDWSNWQTDPNLSIVFKLLEGYSTY